jgi:mRNA interferase HigB
VRVIARSTLSAFVAHCVAPADRKVLEGQVRAWFAAVKAASWKSSAELKSQFRAASILSSDRVVFNLKGNHYRLIVAVDYLRQFVFIKWIGTHAEYDRIDAKTVEYEEERYENSSHS